jgi:hypothetical protein
MADEETCELGLTLAPLVVGSYIDVWLFLIAVVTLVAFIMFTMVPCLPSLPWLHCLPLLAWLPWLPCQQHWWIRLMG